MLRYLHIGRGERREAFSKRDIDDGRGAERGDWVGCIAGDISYSEYRSQLEGAGFGEITLTPTHQVTDGMDSATIKATEPVA